MNAESTATECVETATTTLKQHVSDAAIAAQLSPPTDAQFLAKCAQVREAREKMRMRAGYAGE